MENLTPDQYKEAARRAAQAGDVSTARSLIRRAQEAEAQSLGFPATPEGGVSVDQQAVKEFQPKLDAAVAGAVQGASFGLADEATGAVSAMGAGLVPGGRTAGEAYTQDRDAVRAEHARRRSAEPVAYSGGQIGGGAVTGGLSAPLAAGRTALSTLLRSALLGGAEGTLHGAGNADGAPLVPSALVGGGAGLATGVLAPLAVSGTRAAFNALRNPVTGLVDSLANTANVRKANDAITSMVNRSGQTSDETMRRIQAARDAGVDDFRLMDATGQSGRRMASGLARSGGPTGEQLADFLESRQVDQSQRILNYVDESFGGVSPTKETVQGQVKANRDEVAKSLYGQAARDARPVDVRPALGIMDATISQMGNSGMKPPELVKQFRKLRSRLAGVTPEGDPTTLSDYESVRQLWREMDGLITKQYKDGNGAVAEGLKEVRSSLEASLRESSDLFSTANDLYREGSRVMEAFDTGADFARQPRAQDAIDTFRGLTEQQQRAAQIGFGDRVAAGVEGKTPDAPDARKVINSPRMRAVGQELSRNPDRLAVQLDAERDMAKTFQRATGGSMTADNLADQGAVSNAATGAIRSARGGVVNTALDVADYLGPLAKGHNEATRALIQQGMMSRNPERFMQGASQQEMQRLLREALLASMLRNSANAARQ